MDRSMSPGLLMDLAVGEQVVLHAASGQQIVVTVENKSGRKSRFRVQSQEPVTVIHDDEKIVPVSA